MSIFFSFLSSIFFPISLLLERNIAITIIVIPHAIKAKDLIIIDNVCKSKNVIFIVAIANNNIPSHVSSMSFNNNTYAAKASHNIDTIACDM